MHSDTEGGCSTLNINHIFTSYNNPKGNADTERVMRTIKEDLVWPNEFLTDGSLEMALDKWVQFYNHDYPHSVLGYASPCEYGRLERAA